MTRVDRASREVSGPPRTVFAALVDQAVHEEAMASSLANLAAFVEGR